jgi:hypothetical protein
LCPISATTKQRGEAEELVLRFFAYSDEYLRFKHDVFPFLDRYVKRMNAEFYEPAYESRYQRMLNFVGKNFPYGFRKKLGDNTTPRVRFEAISVGVHLALEESPDLAIENVNWLESTEFKALTTSDGSNNSGRLKGRIEFVRDCLLGKIEQQDLNYGNSQR